MENKYMRQIKAIAKSGVANVIIVFFGVLMLYPVIWLILASFKESSAIFTDPSLIPKAWTLKDGSSVWTLLNYAKGWSGIGVVGFGAFFRNSFFICVMCLLCNAVFCSLTAYAFARLTFPGRKLWFALMMVTLMLPAHVTTIPRYIIFRALGWIDTYLPIIIPKLFATDAFFIFLLVQFIRGLPKELDESALIDGCGKFRIYSNIILPLSLPAIITTVLFTFLWTWDDFFNQLLYLNSPQKYTVPMGLRLFIDSSGMSSWGSMFAMSVLAILPSFALFFSLQKYFVQGIATTGIKS
jgi:multiple sugar transport system permease protein